MIIDDLDIEGVARFEPEADAPLVVDTNAPLSLSLALERFEPVARRHSQVFDSSRGVQHREFPHRHGLDADKSFYPFAVKQIFGFTAFERFNHA